MNNKRLGTQWEREFCAILNGEGFWVHFLSPDSTGAQPFDVIAVRNGKPYAIDCKTLASNVKVFGKDRLEFNQQYAFKKWIECGNGEPYIAIKYNGFAYLLPVATLQASGGSVHMDNLEPWYDLERNEKLSNIFK